jgi:hypothetical protein
MSASKRNPNVWNGEERSGGYIAKNEKPTSANSPDFKGRIYLTGVGWYWISAWTKQTRNGELLAIRAQEMTDEQAEKFCKPKGDGRHTSAGRGTYAPSKNRAQNGADSDSDIPF